MSDYTNPAANDAQNNVDNYERVDIPNPSGTYTITVTHKGALLGGSQNYSLIVTSTNLSSLGTNEAALKGDEILLYPNPTQDFLYFKNNNLIEANVRVDDIYIIW